MTLCSLWESECRNERRRYPLPSSACPTTARRSSRPSEASLATLLVTSDIIRVPFSAAPEPFIDKYLDPLLSAEIAQTKARRKPVKEGELKSCRSLVSLSASEEKVSSPAYPRVDLKGSVIERQ